MPSQGTVNLYWPNSISKARESHWGNFTKH